MENKEQIYTILGAGGAVGKTLTIELLRNNKTVRLVSRSGFKWQGTETIKADITSLNDVISAVNGSDFVFLCAGLPYNTKIWKEYWPKIMFNTIEGCKRSNAKLIFLDNVYSYGKVEGPMTEDIPYNPCSGKGEVRANISQMLLNEIKLNNLKAIIARSADWYGPYSTQTCLPKRFVFDPMLNGKKSKWLIDASKLHSYTYTIDCGKGLYLLSMHPEAFNKTWHLPTAEPPIDGKTFIEIAAKELGVSPEYNILSKRMIRLAGFFDKTVSEAYEMLYQSENDYYFNSNKFNIAFSYTPKPYEEGIPETLNFMKNNN